MPATSNSISSTVSSEPRFTAGGRTRTLEVRRSAQARRMRLAVDPRDGAVRLTLPRRASVAAGVAWAESQRGWIEGALAKVPVATPLGHGAALPFAGEQLTIVATGGARRIAQSGAELRVGGPPELVGGRVLRWLKAQATARLTAETARFAGLAGVTVERVRVGDPRSRWGSCSSSGAIAYSWRLVMAPPAVLEATVAHEVAHRLHMHHGPAFHAEVARLLGREPAAERAWLRAHGAGLQRIGAGDP
jgi:predicted metal-dependent hydrolase